MYVRAGPCRLWFLLPRQSFIHVVSSADPLGLRALFARTFKSRDSLAPLSQKCVTAHQNHTEFISVSSAEICEEYESLHERTGRPVVMGQSSSSLVLSAIKTEVLLDSGDPA